MGRVEAGERNNPRYRQSDYWIQGVALSLWLTVAFTGNRTTRETIPCFEFGPTVSACLRMLSDFDEVTRELPDNCRSAAVSAFYRDLTASTSYARTMAAYDAAGGRSAQSPSGSATTQASGRDGGDGLLPTSLGWYE